MKARSGRLRHRVSASEAAAITSLALAACSSSTSPSATTALSSSGSSAGTTSTTASAGGTVSSSANKLSALTQSLQEAETASFKATYSATDAGESETLTFEQAPPNSLFSTAGAR